MVPSKKQQVITGALMTTAMAFALSGFFSILHAGISPQLPRIWTMNFLMGWPVGFVVSALVAGRVQRLAARLSGARA